MYDEYMIKSVQQSHLHSHELLNFEYTQQVAEMEGPRKRIINKENLCCCESLFLIALPYPYSRASDELKCYHEQI